MIFNPSDENRVSALMFYCGDRMTAKKVFRQLFGREPRVR